MIWVAFEGGSRAGLSTELFFSAYKSVCPNDDVLYVADSDKVFQSVDSQKSVVHVTEKDGILIANEKGMIFPADELTRQRLHKDFRVGSMVHSDVKSWYYDKIKMNEFISTNVKCDQIKVPKTTMLYDAFLRPNSMSAGSKGIMRLSNYCISEYIDIAKEYVVDVFFDECPHIYTRQVVLKGGYDKYIKFISLGSPVNQKIKDFVIALNKTKEPFYKGVFHLQLAEDANGDLWYIESSKRISGTSLVNMLIGYNPFCLIEGKKFIDASYYAEYDTWYRYEDLLAKVVKFMA